MSLGLPEFDEPEPTTDPRSAQESVTSADPASSTPRRCEYTRWGKLYTCTLPHCQVCDGHFDPGKHTEATLCDRCYDWQQVEARMTPEQLARFREGMAALPAFEPGARG